MTNKEPLAIYKIDSIDDKYYEDILKESIDDLNKFYEITWHHHLPRIIVVPDRKTIDLLKNTKTERWIVGWSEGRSVYILDKDALEKESDHKYKPDTYYRLIKHEVSHSFYNIISEGQYKPAWLNEGVAIYTSGQNLEKKKPIKFNNFLDFFEKGGSGVYDESGFAVQLLVEKFGKQKVFELIKKLKSIKSSEEFNNLFEKIFEFKPTYENFNKLYIKSW